jgi:gliding motility-associated lipoprotein GldH
MTQMMKCLGIVFLIVLLWSCDQQRIFDDYTAIPQHSWHKDSIVDFNVPIHDTLDNHNFYINIRNDVEYPYSNLWLFIELTQPDGQFVRDTFEVALANQAGEWLGEGIGGLKTRNAIYRRNIYFPVSGTYNIKLQQGMRNEIVKGISDVGIRIEKSD